MAAAVGGEIGEVAKDLAMNVMLRGVGHSDCSLLRFATVFIRSDSEALCSGVRFRVVFTILEMLVSCLGIRKLAQGVPSL